MERIKIDNKDTIIMNLTHYFITEKNYSPVVVHGINDEIWLENMNSDYKLIRIISRYIHNDEQLKFNEFRASQIVKKLKQKTFSFRMNVINIYVNIGDNVTNLDKSNSKDISLVVDKMSDIKKSVLNEMFPDIVEKTKHEEVGMEYLLKITDEINVTNERKNQRMEKIFSSKKPIITYIFIALCMLMYIVSDFGIDIMTLIKYGANYGLLVKDGEIWRIVTSMFLHAGFLHIFFNLYSLYIVGPKVEDFYGKWKYFLIYMLSGISGSLLSIMMNDNVVSVGASGAIFGLFGALIYMGYNHRGYLGAMVKSQIVPIVIYNLFLGLFLEGIDMLGHIGGLIGGLITSYIVGTIDNKKYNFSNILLGILYFGFLIYMVFFS